MCSAAWPNQRLQELELNVLARMNQRHLASRGEDPLLTARMRSFETAFGMQAEVPEVFDLSKESDATLALYGLERGSTKGFAWQCLVARRLAERGVRFIELIDSGSSNNWDAHGDMLTHEPLAKNVDQPVAGLLRDLKQRGMLDDTLVVFTTEFGRTPFNEGAQAKGREHHHWVFSSWLAGAGVKAGQVHGASDEFRHQRRTRRSAHARLPRHDSPPHGARPRAPHLPAHRSRLPAHGCRRPCRERNPRLMNRLLPLFSAIVSAAAPLQADPQIVPHETAVAGEVFTKQIRPLLKDFCLDCHSTAEQKGDLDLETFDSLDSIRKHPKIWQNVAEQLANGEMPPKKKPQPKAEEKERLAKWVMAMLDEMARARAGDPGPVVLRRLSNAEYTYTLRDLTGIPTLDPAKEFPVDGAAGEGFTNTGQALVMSPALITKYLDAAKQVASHAVLLPDGMRFSPSTTRRDWTQEIVEQIRDFYNGFTDPRQGASRAVQGVAVDTKNEGGRLPIEKYLAATIEERAALATGAKSAETVANERGLNARYLSTLFAALTGGEPSMLLDRIRSRWREAKPADVAPITAEIAQWQKTLWRFNSVGHIGKTGGPNIVDGAGDADRVAAGAADETPACCGWSGGRALPHCFRRRRRQRGRCGDVAAAAARRAGRTDLLLRDVRMRQPGDQGTAATRLCEHRKVSCGRGGSQRQLEWEGGRRRTGAEARCGCRRAQQLARLPRHRWRRHAARGRTSCGKDHQQRPV